MTSFKIFTPILCSLTFIGAIANPVDESTLSAVDTIIDNRIVYPSSFDTDVRTLQDHWYMQRYAVLDSIARNRSGKHPTDEIYIDRLQKLPNIIDMPFNSVVKNYIEFYAYKKPELVEKMLGISLYYMPYFEEALEKEGMPTELKYLPVIESALNPNAVSKVGACGLWQFMPSTAQGEGLEINSLVDERRDPIASSDAACKYLKKLYKTYGDWTLVLAAYNCGPGNVNKAMKRAGDSKDYWEIYPYLPAETRGYVPAFIAANYIMNYYAEHGISHALARRPIVTDTVHVHSRVHMQQIADVLDIPIDDIRNLNPQYRNDVIPGHIRPYTLILPSEQAYCFVANQDTIFAHDYEKYFTSAVKTPSDGIVKKDSNGKYIEETIIVQHKVKKGESLKSIAAHYGVSQQSIRTQSKLKTSKVKVGTTLSVPTIHKRYLEETELATDNSKNITSLSNSENKSSASSKPITSTKSSSSKTVSTSKPATPAPARQSSHKVKKGDTLDKMAKQYGVTVKEIQAANGLKNSNIQIGQTLMIPAKSTKSKTSTTKSTSSKKKTSKKK